MKETILSLTGLAIVLTLVFLNTLYLKKKVKREVDKRERERERQLEIELSHDFLSSISHKLRTPMNIITSLAYLLSRTELDANQKNKVS